MRRSWEEASFHGEDGEEEEEEEEREAEGSPAPKRRKRTSKQVMDTSVCMLSNGGGLSDKTIMHHHGYTGFTGELPLMVCSLFLVILECLFFIVFFVSQTQRLCALKKAHARTCFTSFPLRLLPNKGAMLHRPTSEQLRESFGMAPYPSLEEIEGSSCLLATCSLGQGRETPINIMLSSVFTLLVDGSVDRDDPRPVYAVVAVKCMPRAFVSFLSPLLDTPDRQ